MIGADGIQTNAAFGFMVIALTIIIAPLAAQRVRLPGLVGLLLGGALIGPNMLSVLPDFSGLQSIGDIGVLYLIFLAGLGLDLKTFTEYRRVAVVFGLLPDVMFNLATLRLACGLRWRCSSASSWPRRSREASTGSVSPRSV